MILQLTDFVNNKPVYVLSEHIIAMHTVGTDKPHTYIILTNNSLQIKEEPEVILKMMKATVKEYMKLNLKDNILLRGSEV